MAEIYVRLEKMGTGLSSTLRPPRIVYCTVVQGAVLWAWAVDVDTRQWREV